MARFTLWRVAFVNPEGRTLARSSHPAPNCDQPIPDRIAWELVAKAYLPGNTKAILLPVSQKRGGDRFWPNSTIAASGPGGRLSADKLPTRAEPRRRTARKNRPLPCRELAAGLKSSMKISAAVDRSHTQFDAVALHERYGK
jgi:hypothetical protein